MFKMMFGILAAALCLAACGGGDSGNPQATSKALTISMYGKPIVAAPTAVAHEQFSLISNAEAADAPTNASDTQATVQSLQEALAARGVTSNITPQVMDGTTLHQLVTDQYNGVAPSQSLLTKDPSEWVIVNFQLDDMVTPDIDPAQVAATEQFTQDLLVFSQWAAVAGKRVFVIMPIITCDTFYSASLGLTNAITNARGNGAPVTMIVAQAPGFSFDPSGNLIPGQDTSHMGADCRTPDAYLQNLVVGATADMIAEGYKEAQAASAASGASASGT